MSLQVQECIGCTRCIIVAKDRVCGGGTLCKLCLGVCDRRQCPCASSCSGTDRILAAAWVEQGVPFCLFVERLVGGCKV